MTTTLPRSGGATRRRRSDRTAAALFLLPLAVMYAVYYGYSIVFLAKTSFTKVSITFFHPIAVGWRNYQQLVTDPIFVRALANTLVFAALSIAAALTVGFFVSVALSTGVRPKRLLYLVFLVPTLMPSSLVATIFGSMLQERYGIVNTMLRSVGLGSLAQPWLTRPGLAFGVVAVIFCYLIGLPIMYFTADFSTLPTDSIEAALIDGAGTFRIMGQIIYPMMRATRLTILLSLLLGSFRALEVVLFSTQGGPGNTTEIVGSYLYGFESSSGATIGFVSAASVIVLLVAFVISVAQMVVMRVRKESR